MSVVGFTLTSVSIGPDNDIWRFRIGVPTTGTTFYATGQTYTTDAVIGTETFQTETHPGVPVSGTNYVTLQFRLADGVISVKSATDAFPAADVGNTAFANQAVDSGEDVYPPHWPGWQFLF